MVVGHNERNCVEESWLTLLVVRSKDSYWLLEVVDNQGVILYENTGISMAVNICANIIWGICSKGINMYITYRININRMYCILYPGSEGQSRPSGLPFCWRNLLLLLDIAFFLLAVGSEEWLLSSLEGSSSSLWSHLACSWAIADAKDFIVALEKVTFFPTFHCFYYCDRPHLSCASYQDYGHW